jgi:hypothetical protein
MSVPLNSQDYERFKKLAEAVVENKDQKTAERKS